MRGKIGLGSERRGISTTRRFGRAHRGVRELYDVKFGDEIGLLKRTRLSLMDQYLG